MKKYSDAAIGVSGFLDKDTEFTGEIKFSKMLRIDGIFKGRITAGDTLHVGATGNIEADIDVSRISINGKVKGTIKASEIVEIFNKGRVLGTIVTPKLMIEEGAFFQGECKMIDKKIPELTEGKKSKSETYDSKSESKA